MADTAAEAPETLARALKWGRDKFNARFEYFTKTLRKPVDPEEFSIHLIENVGPVAQAVEAVDPVAVNKTVEGLYEVSLELLAAGYVGLNSRYQWPEKVFRDLMPAAAPFITQNPRLVAGSLVNASAAMEAEPSARTDDWVKMMKSAASVAKTPKELLDAGMILAWKCGMAHFRHGALKLVNDIPEPLALALFPDEAAATQEELTHKLSRVWTDAQASDISKKTRKPVTLLGGFTGFGGQFDSPPVVFLEEGAIAAIDSSFIFDIFADRFGAVVKKRGPAPSGKSRERRDKKLDEIAKAAFPKVTAEGGQTKSWVYDGATMAVSLTVSHKIFLFALTRP